MIFEKMKTDFENVLKKYIKVNFSIKYCYNNDCVVFYIDSDNEESIQININYIYAAPIKTKF